jgi:dTDP-4-amino-4,6-dideoxygalactose transaminase
MQRIPLHDVLAQNEAVRTDITSAIASVIDRGMFIHGPQLQRFETEFGQYLGLPRCVGVANATDGFEILFQALGLPHGAEIIIPANAHVSPALAALKAGLKPIFCDVEPSTMLISVDDLRKRKTTRTAIVVAVHLYGRVCNMKRLHEFCAVENLMLIEDFSQAHGATFNGQKVGTFGKASVCSFYPTKPLGAFGDGGAIVSSDEELLATCRSLTNYGWKQRDNASLPGRNSRLDELQAAILNVKLSRLNEWNAERVARAKELEAALGTEFNFTPLSLNSGDVCHLFVVRSNVREDLIKKLKQLNIDCQVHYPIPIHLQTLFRPEVSLPMAEKLCEEVLSVPADVRILDRLHGSIQ